jgi:hypothetical protein
MRILSREILGSEAIFSKEVWHSKKILRLM